MTMFWVDGVPVIFEGVARIRWDVTSECGQMFDSVAQEVPPQPKVGAVWPTGSQRSSVRRWIKMLGPTLVFLDSSKVADLKLPPQRVPVVPDGTTVVRLPDGQFLLSVKLLDWLDQVDQIRGLNFFEGAKRHRMRATPRTILIEDHPSVLHQPVRFACHTGGVGLNEIRATISRCFANGRSAIAGPAGDVDLAAIADAA